MSILIDKDTKVLTQGMTGKTGTFHTEQALAYRHPDGWRYPPEEGRHHLDRR
jgi:succinyl-CoA synthetase alpha subunit